MTVSDIYRQLDLLKSQYSRLLNLFYDAFVIEQEYRSCGVIIRISRDPEDIEDHIKNKNKDLDILENRISQLKRDILQLQLK